jgi:predicted P-loop ATPase
MDKYSVTKMVLLKNLMQMAGLNIRKAYKKSYTPLPRIASFIGTSNQMELLTDPTGSRRFLCVEVEKKIDVSPLEHAQIYAQLKAELAAGSRHWFTGDEENQLKENNAPFRRQDLGEEVFHTRYRLPLAGEKGQMLSATVLYDELRKTYPTVMRQTNVRTFTHSLTALGIPRVHTRVGNLYHVVALQA